MSVRNNHIQGLSGRPAGIYIVRVTSGGTSGTARLVKN